MIRLVVIALVAAWLEDRKSHSISPGRGTITNGWASTNIQLCRRNIDIGL